MRYFIFFYSLIYTQLLPLILLASHFLSILQNIRNNKRSILNTIKTILEEFNVTKLFSTEIELKNIHRYLEVAIEFENNDQKHKTDLSGFLSYCRSLEEKDEYSQLGQMVSDSIKLLTIHKSKGLQFETVFSFMNIPKNQGQHNLGLKLYYDFKFVYDIMLPLQKSVVWIFDRLNLKHKLNLEYEVKHEHRGIMHAPIGILISSIVLTFIAFLVTLILFVESVLIVSLVESPS